MRRTRLVVWAAVAALALPACSGAGAPGRGAGVVGSTETATAPPSEDATVTAVPQPAPPPVQIGLEPDAKGPAPRVEGARRGGTLTIATSASPTTFDPSAQYAHDVTGLLRLTHRTLTTYAVRDGRTVLVPDLATDLGTVSEDRLSWTFTLKRGLRYEDGSPVVAADVAYAIRRSFAREELGGGPAYQLDYLLDGDTYKGPWTGPQEFGGVAAPDARTVVINLRKPWPSLPYFAAFTQTSPIPEAEDTGERYTEHPVATGPYRFSSYRPGEELVLVRNRHWKAATDPARHQFPESIRVEFSRDTIEVGDAIMASEGGDATTLSYDGAPLSVYDEVTGDRADQLVSGPSPCVTYVTMDVRKIPLEVRRAVALAWPYDQIRAAASMTDLDYDPATTIGPAVIPGFEPFELPGLTGQGTGSPEDARDLLAAADAEGFELSWYYASDDPLQERVNEVRKAQLEEAGFKVKDIGVPRADIRRVRADPEATVNLMQGPSGWCFDWPSGDGFYPSILRSSVVDSGHSAGFLTEPAVDQEIDRIAALPVQEQGPEWSELDEHVLATYLPLLPVNYHRSTFIFGTKVHHVVNDPNTGMPHLAVIWVGE